jgi:hypothetical protein
MAGSRPPARTSIVTCLADRERNSAACPAEFRPDDRNVLIAKVRGLGWCGSVYAGAIRARCRDIEFAHGEPVAIWR